jgi:hypothetical protein
MLRLIADLKGERDELKRDVDGWRQRVNDLENQTAILAKRVESERREAWIARSQAGLLEVEKGVLSKRLEAVDDLIKIHEKEKEIWEKDKISLENEVQEYKQRVGELENELKVMKKEFVCEQAYDPLATPTPNKSFGSAFIRPVVIISPPEPTVKPKKHGLGFMSVDSESSTDVDSSSDDPASDFGLKAVEEELDEAYDDENGLAGYEDEDEADGLSQGSSSSFDSEEFNHLTERRPAPNTPTSGIYKALPPAPVPSHFYHSSLSTDWTFPKGPAAVEKSGEEGVDRFFDCLDDDDSEGNDSIPTSFSYEKSKGLFARGFALAPEDDDAAFFLPSGIGIPLPEEPVMHRTQLEAVAEEEEGAEEEEEEQRDIEDDGAMFGEIGGIKITFTPPQEEDQEEEEEKEQIQVSPPKAKRISPPPVLPALNFGSNDEDDPFNFGLPSERPPVKSAPVSSPASPAVKSVPVPAIVSSPPPVSIVADPSSASSTSSPSSVPRSTSGPTSPSMIPRVVSPTVSSRVTSPGPVIRSSSLKMSRSPTPSAKPTPSIRQPPVRSAPIPPPKPKTAPTSTFIRQPPVKKPLPAKSVKNVGSSSNGSTVPAVVRRFY